MSSSLIIGLEMALVLGGVLAFGFHELLSLRRERRRDEARREAEAKASEPARRRADRPT